MPPSTCDWLVRVQSHWDPQARLVGKTAQRILREYGVQRAHTIWPRDPSPRHLPYRNENLRARENLHVSILAAPFIITANCKQPKYHLMWIVKQTVKRPHRGILLSNLRKLLIHTTAWMNFRGIKLHEKASLKRIIYFMIQFIWLSRKEKAVVMENRCWLPGVGVGGGMNQRTAGGSVFVGMKQLRILMVVAVTGIYTCVVLKFIGLCNNKKSILLMLIYKMEQTRKDLGLFFFSDNKLIANKTSIDSGTTKTKLLKDYPLPCEQNPLISVNIYLQWQSRCRFIPRSMLSKYL